jgi:hypothetical protein
MRLTGFYLLATNGQFSISECFEKVKVIVQVSVRNYRAPLLSAGIFNLKRKPGENSCLPIIKWERRLKMAVGTCLFHTTMRFSGAHADVGKRGEY